MDWLGYCYKSHWYAIEHDHFLASHDVGCTFLPLLSSSSQGQLKKHATNVSERRQTLSAV